MSERNGRDHVDSQTAPSKGASAQNTPEIRVDGGLAWQENGCDHAEVCLQDEGMHTGDVRRAERDQKSGVVG